MFGKIESIIQAIKNASTKQQSIVFVFEATETCIYIPNYVRTYVFLYMYINIFLQLRVISAKIKQILRHFQTILLSDTNTMTLVYSFHLLLTEGERPSILVVDIHFLS